MVGSLVLGILAAIGGLAIPDARPLLFAFSGTGLFGGLLAYSLSANRLVTAVVVDRVSTAAAANQLAIAEAVTEKRDPVYVASDGIPPAILRLSSANEPTPSGDSFGRLASEDDSKLTFEPSAGRLFCDFERTLRGELATAPRPLAAQLSAGLVDLFELAEAVEPITVEDESITLIISGSVLGDLDRFDHPTVSFLAVGFAVGLERSVSLEVVPGTDEDEWRVTCRWDSIEGSSR